MLRWIKFGLGTMVMAGIAGFAILGTDFGSYLWTTTNAAQESIRNSVPVEFELRRASDMIQAILPDLQSQVRMIAQEEVEIASLESDITSTQQRLRQEQQTLASLRSKMRVHEVSYTIYGREIEREQLADQLHQRFNRFKQGELALASKQKLLQKRQDGLRAAMAMLGKMRHRKGELEQKVEALAAQHRLVQATVIESGRLVDGSQLSEADQLLQQIETRLAVAQRVLAHEQDLFDVNVAEELADEEQLLSELDEYFKDADAAENIVTGLRESIDVEAN